MKIDIRGEIDTGVEVHSHTNMTYEEVVMAITSLAYLFGEDQEQTLDLLGAAVALIRRKMPKTEVTMLDESESGPEGLS